MSPVVMRFIDKYLDKAVARERFIEVGLNCSAFLFKSDRALDVLISRLAAGGMSEDAVIAELEIRRARYQRMLLIAALVLLIAGFAIREVFGETTAGRIGSVVMFFGLVATAIRVKRSDKPSPMSMQTISEAFRKK